MHGENDSIIRLSEYLYILQFAFILSLLIDDAESLIPFGEVIEILNL